MKKKSLLTGLAVAALLISAQTSFASHFRGGKITGSIDSSGMLTVKQETFWRTDFVDSVGVTANGSFMSQLSTTMDTSDSRFTVRNSVFTKQLTGGVGTQTINLLSSNCCRNSGITNINGSNWDLETTLSWDGQNSAATPDFNLVAIQPEVVRGQAYAQSLGAVSPTGSALSFDKHRNDGIASQPATGFTVTPAGILSLSSADTTSMTYDNTLSNSAGADYAFSGAVKDANGNSVEFDWLFDAVCPVGQNCTQNHAPNVADSALTVTLGQSANFTATGSDPDSDPLTWSLAGFLGSPAVAPAFNTATQAFSWDTTGSALGTYIAQIRAADTAGLTDIGIYTINVVAGGTQPVPEPATLLLTGLGLVTLAATRRKKQV